MPSLTSPLQLTSPHLSNRAHLPIKQPASSSYNLRSPVTLTHPPHPLTELFLRHTLHIAPNPPHHLTPQHLTMSAHHPLIPPPRTHSTSPHSLYSPISPPSFIPPHPPLLYYSPSGCSSSRVSCLFFISFVVIGVFFLCNYLLAVVYNAYSETERMQLEFALAQRRISLQEAFRQPLP